MTRYKLLIYGGANIEETVNEFESVEKAKNYAEGQSSGDITEWKDEGDKLVMIDYNHSDDMENTVISKITEI